MHRYRLMWNETKYEPGEVEVVAYDEYGNITATKKMVTAGKRDHLVLTDDGTAMVADGEDLVYITVRVADKDGNFVPTDNRLVKFKVNGAGKFRATANGDPTCLYPFQNPEMPLFSGALTLIVQSANTPGILKVEATASGLKSDKMEILVK